MNTRTFIKSLVGVLMSPLALRAASPVRPPIPVSGTMTLETGGNTWCFALLEPTNKWVRVTNITSQQLEEIQDSLLQEWHDVTDETPEQTIAELRNRNGWTGEFTDKLNGLANL